MLTIKNMLILNVISFSILRAAPVTAMESQAVAAIRRTPSSNGLQEIVISPGYSIPVTEKSKTTILEQPTLTTLQKQKLAAATLGGAASIGIGITLLICNQPGVAGPVISSILLAGGVTTELLAAAWYKKQRNIMQSTNNHSNTPVANIQK